MACYDVRRRNSGVLNTLAFGKAADDRRDIEKVIGTENGSVGSAIVIKAGLRRRSSRVDLTPTVRLRVDDLTGVTRPPIDVNLALFHYELALLAFV